MGNLIPLYTSLNGRIGRKTWWLASIGLAVVIVIVEFLILAPLGFSYTTGALALSAKDGGDAAAEAAAFMSNLHKSMWAAVIVYVVFALPILALGIKRRHDRGNGGIDFMVFYAIVILFNLAQAIGFGYSLVDISGGISVPIPTMPLAVIEMLLGVYSIYLLVVLGFLKGTPGANQYGPDPTGLSVPAAA